MQPQEFIRSWRIRVSGFGLVPAETLQLDVALCLEGGQPDQELAQNILQELLHLFRTQK